MVKRTLDSFCSMSGQSISASKSHFYTSKNLQPVKRDFIQSTTGIPYTSSFCKYLGFPVKDGTLNSLDYHFILEKIQNKLQGWKANLLSFARRKTIIQGSSLPIVNYYAQCVDLLVALCDHVIRSIGNFFGVARLTRNSYTW